MSSLLAWAERNGYVLDYAVTTDLEFHPDLLQHYKLVLSVGMMNIGRLECKTIWSLSLLMVETPPFSVRILSVGRFAVKKRDER